MTEEKPAPADAEARAPEPIGSQTGRRMRARLARIGSRSQVGNPVLEPLFRAVRANHPKAELALLERDYLPAKELHGPPRRQSGDPYNDPPFGRPPHTTTTAT